MNSAKPFNLSSYIYIYLYVDIKRNKSFFTITYFNFDDTKEKEDDAGNFGVSSFIWFQQLQSRCLRGRGQS